MSERGKLLEEYRVLLQSHTVETPLPITRETLLRLLRQFLAAELQAEELTEWANLVELRDEVEYERGYEEVIANTLFALSTPEINDPVDAALCRLLIEQLSQS